MQRFQIHSHILAAFLQLAPLARIVQNTPGMIVNPTVFLLRWVFGTAAVAGSFHGLSGATGVVPSVVQATNGVRASVTFSITSPFHGTARSYSASGLPPGMTLSTRGTLSGTPTTSGSYTLKLRGWQTTDQGGNWSDQNVAVSVVGAIPTAITLQPTSLTVAPSEAATFTATVTGDPPVALRWFREDLEVLNATNATLTLPKVQATDAGRYRLRVVSDLGTVFSDWATLTVTAVDDTPTISEISAQTTLEDTATGPIAFTVGDVETAATSLTVTATSSNQALVAAAGIALGGNGSNRTITLTPVANASGTSTITVTVADGTGGLTATRSFVLTVSGGPLVTPESLALRVVGPMVAGRMELEIRAPKGVTVSLEASVDLNTWNEAQSLTGQGSAQPLTLTPAIAPEEGTRFWRLRVR